MEGDGQAAPDMIAGDAAGDVVTPTLKSLAPGRHVPEGSQRPSLAATSRRIVCLACVKAKRPEPAPAGDLYTSPLFRLSLAYARTLEPDLILILSAKHGVLRLEDRVAPYNETLLSMPARERAAWANRVIEQLRDLADLDTDRFAFLAGRRYRDGMIPHIRTWEAPMEGLGIGRQLGWLKQQVG